MSIVRAWVLFAIVGAAQLLLGWASVRYAGAGRGGLRGHAGEYPMMANALHIIALFAIGRGAGAYRFFWPHLAIVGACLVVAVLTTDRTRADGPRLIAAVRAVYACAYAGTLALLALS
jgi:hypothetical protein